MQLLARAKLNLGLRVVGLRPDGYHLLDSFFVPLTLADRVRVELDESGEVGLAESPGAPPVPEDENLAVRAARAYLSAAGSRRGVRLGLTKEIPIGAG